MWQEMYVDILLLYGVIWMGKYRGGMCCDVLYCIVWLRYYVAWYSKVWCTEVDGMVQYGVVHYSVWCDMNGMVWDGKVRYGIVRYGTLRYDTIRYCTIRYATVRYGRLRFGTVRYGTGKVR